MSISRWFKKPSFTHGAPDISEPKETAAAQSSPLSEPPSSFVYDDLLPASEQDADAQLKAALQLSTRESVPAPSVNNSFQSIETEATGTSQRIIKNGKETVISSDGEETDSDCSLEDAGSLFPRVAKNKASTPLKPVCSPKKWKYNLDSLVHEAVDDNEIEATVDRYRANLAEKPKTPVPLGNKLDESMLLKAIGQKEDGPQPHRVLGAIRRTNALDYDRNWLFFDPTQELPPAPEFPHVGAAGAKLEILNDRGSRERLFMSTDFILTALSKGMLSDEVVLWMLQSIPYERDELNAAFGRIMERMDPEHLGSIIRPADVDELFQRLGARRQALDPLHKIAPMSHHEITTATKLKNHAPLISVLKLFRGTDIISSLADDTMEHIILLLLRLAVDSSLTADPTVYSELQCVIELVLDPRSFEGTDPKEAIHRVCSTFYETVDDVCLQSRIAGHIIPSSPWLAEVRCRLAVSFLLEDPSPLHEPPQTLLDLNRITELLARDRRFQVKRFQGKADYDWRELIALTALLNIAIDVSALELNYRGDRTEDDFNADIDKLASQLKTMYCSIQVSGASHMTLALAKGDLEALHYRILYSIRSKPPPKKTLFESHVNDNQDIRRMLSKYSTRGDGNTGIPLR